MTQGQVRGWPPYVLALAAALLLAVTAVVLIAPRASLYSIGIAFDFVTVHATRRLLSQTGLTFAGIIMLMMLELLLLRWEKTTLFRLCVRRSPSAKIDIAYSLLLITGLTTIAENVFTLGLALGGSRLADAVSSDLGWFRFTLPTRGVFSIAAGFCVYWLVSTFFEYWNHRLTHSRNFWHLHRFHHAATELNILTAFRVHPVEPITKIFLALSPMIFFKVSGSILLVAFFVGTLTTLLAHSELPWSYGLLGRWFIAAPLVHQVHHSIDDEHRDTNFGNCPLWDHLFGTWYDGPNRPSGYGIPDRSHDEHPMTQWMKDAWLFYRGAATTVVAFAQTRMGRFKRPARSA